MKGLARVTNGRFTFIAPNTSVDIHVAEQLARALHPSITDVSVKWETSQTILYKVPERAPPVFVGDRLLFYALLDESMPFDHTITVELVSNQHQQPLGVVRVDHIPPVLSSQTITRLAAKALLRDLLHASVTTSKERLVDISIKYGILCPYTAFIGVEKRLDADVDSNANMELREVAIMPGPSLKNRYFALPSSRCRTSSDTSSSGFDSLRSQVDDVTSIMRDNVAFILERGEPLSMLEAQADTLSERLRTFSACSANVRYQKRSRAVVSSVLQPIAGFFSSLLIKKSVAPPTHAASQTHHQLQQDLEFKRPKNEQQDLKFKWPKNEPQLVDYFIERQQYDGLWILTEDDVKQLTGKSLTDFSSSVLDMTEKSNQTVITTTTLVIAILESRCSSSKILWQALSNKAHKRLIELLGGDQAKLEELIKDIRNQLL